MITHRWPPEIIAHFREAFNKLRASSRWPGDAAAAERLGYSKKYLAWAAGEHSADTWPGSIRLTRALNEIFGLGFAPPRRQIVFLLAGWRAIALQPGERITKSPRIYRGGLEPGKKLAGQKTENIRDALRNRYEIPIRSE